MDNLALIPIGFFIGAVLGTAQKQKRESYQIKFINSNKKGEFFSKEEFKIERGAICSECGVRISLENIGMLTEKDGRKHYICSKSHCQKFNRLPA